jgi:murein L,D-transpeptidase YafK
MKTLLSILFAGLCLILAASGFADQAAPKPSTPAAVKFKPPPAHKKFPRVRAARERRTEDIKKLFAEAGLDYPPAQILLRAFKKDDILELWVRPLKKKKFIHLKDYAICSKSGVLGPKLQRGDLQVPEGFYKISWFNAHSDFLLSMKVSYPNPADRVRSKKRDPGGSIFIHGACVTIGCIPLTDRWIEELYLICLDPHWRYGNKTLVHIFPTKMNAAGMEWLKKEFAEKPELLAFWEEIKVGYDRFEESNIPAKYTILKNGTYRFHKKR